MVEAVVESEERETLGEVLAESVIGLSKHEMTGKGKKKKKKKRRATKGSKEGRPERVREPPTGDGGQHPSDKAWDSFMII